MDALLLGYELHCQCAVLQGDPQRWNRLAERIAKLEPPWLDHLSEQPDVICWLCGSLYYPSSTSLSFVDVDEDDSPALAAFQGYKRPHDSKLRQPRVSTTC